MFQLRCNQLVLSLGALFRSFRELLQIPEIGSLVVQSIPVNADLPPCRSPQSNLITFRCIMISSLQSRDSLASSGYQI